MQEPNDASPSSLLMSDEELGQFGSVLARSHKVTKKRATGVLLKRLAASERSLFNASAFLTQATLEGKHITPAAEWLLDNFYLIEEQIRLIKRHLPKKYEKSLPQLASGFMKQSNPRVYDIAYQMIRNTDAVWSLESLTRYINAYQRITQLTLGELWAIPIMLRLALIENLSHLSSRVVKNLKGHYLADVWAKKFEEEPNTNPKKLLKVPLTGQFIAELVRHLHRNELHQPLNWFMEVLAKKGISVEEMVLLENTQQAANQVTVSSSIGSLRLLSEVDWRNFVEHMSVVEEMLYQDPVDCYRHMDFSTRDRYRHVVESLARDSQHSEMSVATTVIRLASQEPPVHVGYYLIDDGLPELRSVLGLHNGFISKKRHAFAFYLGSITVLVLVTTSILLVKASHSDMNIVGLLLLAIVMVVCISQAAVSLVNWAAMLWVAPQLLPKMDFSKAIPESCRTLVVVPSMIGTLEQVESLMIALEVRYLGNRDEHLHFALLTDFNDAANEAMQGDQALIDFARSQIIELNKRYIRPDEDIFFLLHRPRRWNASENVWMGHERKRGKLSDLNKLLRGSNAENFLVIEGRTNIFNQIKYVITLDTDTQLPRDSARQLIGTMAHPLNTPVYDQKRKRVISGYGILQPRIAESIVNPGPSRYIRLCGNDVGVDPYTRAVSNVYQDLFEEGSFIGKGIYDVDLFHEILGRALPDNRILSHDLLEGCYLRCGFVSDVPLYETTPGSYLTDVKRRARWIRGDWQLMGWLSCPSFSALSKWKLFDNLRRSVVSFALLLLLMIGSIVLPATNFWFYVIIAILLFPWFTATLVELVRKPKDMNFNQHANSFLPIIHHGIEKLILYLSCLPHETWYSMKAIVRTLWRLKISHRHLLEWTPSDQIDHQFHDTLIEWYKTMWMGPVLAVTMGFVLIEANRLGSFFAALPLLILWTVSPLMAYWFSRPFVHKEADLNHAQTRFLHRVARKTWAFFETFVAEEDHWLPPDNYQEVPVPVVSHRTSPTNIGLALLTNLTAYDFGYISTAQALERISNTLQTLFKLDRHRGHLYNWYDTVTLEPLYPRYISTVDSGNLAGHLLTLRQGLLEWMDSPILRITYLQGIEDTLDVMIESVTVNQDSFGEFRELLNNGKLEFDTGPHAFATAQSLVEAAQTIAQNLTENVWSQALLRQCIKLREDLASFEDDLLKITDKTTLRELHGKEALSRIAAIETLSDQTFELAQMDMRFLYNQTMNLFTIGFNMENQTTDKSYYDLLSSEARLANYIAVAQGQVPQESWFSLGRLQIMGSHEQPVMMSWSGSMFEYLMPMLVMPSYPGTLLDQVCHSAVNRQIEYGKQRKVPWGISESGYFAVDVHTNYLYRAFGVPELGFKRGLSEDLVIAPYATVMALMVEPEAACMNLERLADKGALGQYGFYEALDYTASRMPRYRDHILIRSFMAHHQGMSLLSFSYLLHDQPMQRRFAADPLIQSSLLLLQERIPKPVSSYFQLPKSALTAFSSEVLEEAIRVFNSPNTAMPEIQLLSNGRYHVGISQAGAGFSRWKNLAVTRWREDGVCDNWGLFAYIRDMKTGHFWSTIYQPTAGNASEFRTIFSQGYAEFHRKEDGIHVRTEVVVSPEDDVEIRRLHIHNLSATTRTIEFTTYAEVALVPQGSDEAQPAFNNLFIETEFVEAYGAVMAKRRPRSEEESSPVMFQKLNIIGNHSLELSFETERTRFIGRGRTAASPLAMIEEKDLSNTVGTVLDPIIAIRCRITLKRNESIVIGIVSGSAESYDQAFNLVKKYHDHHSLTRAFELAGTYGQVILHQMNITAADAKLFTKIASALIYNTNIYRADPGILSSNRLQQSKLWPYSISGDLPIVLLSIEKVQHIDIVHQLMKAQIYWRRHGVMVDLVILNEEAVSYRQVLQDQIMSVVSSSKAVNSRDGDIYVLIAEGMPIEDRHLIESVARAIFYDKRGTLKEQVKRKKANHTVYPKLQTAKIAHELSLFKLEPLPDLLFYNGSGGFSLAGTEYIIRLGDGENTFAPWINILANPHFGTYVSESGRACTWLENAHECRLTPWDNDAVRDSAGEAFYIRDDETGQCWSPTALPCRGQGEYQVRHGFGYSIFEHIEDNIYSELTVFVSLNQPVKLMVLNIRNDEMNVRRLSVMGYVEWVLGDYRSKNAPHVVTDIHHTGAIMAENPYSAGFGEQVAFFSATTSCDALKEKSLTGDRLEFIGRNRTQENPQALDAAQLSGSVGAGLDPCGAIHLAFDLAAGEMRKIVFVLGGAKNKAHAEHLAEHYQDIDLADLELESICTFWRETLHAVQVKTPDPAVDIITNGWLVYQTLSSRLWGRTGFYQSSGAFGFRDQLQDVMALVHTKPELLRAQLLLCASRQFVEGDVQHWWHPPLGQGVRTRCSDDYLWLPFALCRYVQTTGDTDILDEQVSFLQGRPLNEGEESYYEIPAVSNEVASVYQHAVRSIQHGFQWGKHGLPLMGSGDWNDGMNLVGIKGQGESVWLGFFFYTVLQQFAKMAERYGDKPFSDLCKEQSTQLQKNLEEHAWDGKWYRRAYFDDGMPLGSSVNTECRIDSIAQSWSVLSGAASAERMKQAMSSLHEYLVREEDHLVALLTPPFERSKPSPGYIQGYVAGIRENGGQYTHAAAWAGMAFAALGEHDHAWQVFNIVNPIQHSNSKESVATYKIEPYVLAGDVYSVAPHIGRGGWSWYTGSAGWMYHLVIESLMGIELVNGKELHLTPRLPKDWDHVTMDYRVGEKVYHIDVKQTSGNLRIEVNGVLNEQGVIHL